MSDCKEAVRLPGIINMEIEANKLYQNKHAADSGTDDQDTKPEKSMHLNVPLQISVDSVGAGMRRVLSPAAGKPGGRSGSVESRGRISSAGVTSLDAARRQLRGSASRVRSASAGRDKKQEMAARYWAVLFENLKRAVDDLFRTCEMDESCIAAKEVVMVLENNVKDFKNLINWLKLKTEYENTPVPRRPTSLTWDIRKTSPAGKYSSGSSGKLTPTRQLLLASPARRQLNFEEGTRTRKVSETIKEAKSEWEGSLTEVRETSPRHDQPVIISCEYETSENLSEHEKSDSEQEKDCPTRPESEKSDSEVETKEAQEADNAKTKASEVDNDATDCYNVVRQTINLSDTTPASIELAEGTPSESGPLLLTAVADDPGQASRPKTRRSTTNRKAGTSLGAGTPVLASQREKSAEKCCPRRGTVCGGQEEGSGSGDRAVKCEKSTDKLLPGAKSASGKTSSGSANSSATTGSTTVATSVGTPPAAGYTKKTFACTVKSSAAGATATGAGNSKVAAGRYSSAAVSGVQTYSAMTTSQTSAGNSAKVGVIRARMTRALTTIGTTPPPPKDKNFGRRSQAGLLMTSISAARSEKHSASLSLKSNLKRPDSGRQQRISLVARQAQFASQVTSARAAAPAAAGPCGGKSGGGAGTGSSNAARAAPSGADDLPFGSSTSLSSGSSGRSWAETVRGEEELRSADNLAGQLPGSTRASHEEEDGWCTVRRARSRFSPASLGSNSSLKGASSQAARTSATSKAKNRFKMPSSAVSMPSLTLDETAEEEGGGQGGEGVAENHLEQQRVPGLEKSASSASIVRAKQGQVARLGSLSEQRGQHGGSSADSLNGDPSVIKKKKDQINHSKQKALLRGDQQQAAASKALVKKTRSAPGRTQEEAAVQAPATTASHDNETDTDSDEILERDAAIAKAELEAADLQRELRETEQEELTDTDADTEIADNEESYNTESDAPDAPGPGPGSMTEAGIEALLDGLSWAEQMELEEQLAEAQESRYPGRALQLHEKLSSPARKREPHETYRFYQEKQDKARIRRLHFSEEKAQKLAILNQRITEVLEQRDRLVEERKAMIENKLKKAEEKRIQHIEGIRKKAHEEEEKLKEIAFINELQAQNTRIDMLAQVSTSDEKCEERLAELAGERAKKAEQREEREARAEERRRAMEEQRQRNLEIMIEKRREREERIQGCQAAAREQRKVSARMKDQERLERLSTVRAAEKDMKEELQEKIQQKQEDAAKRHAENLENIRQRAFELSVQKCSNDEGVPVIEPYKTKKKCEACNVLIRSEVHLLSHLRGKQHAEEITRKNEGKDLSGAEITTYNLKHIVDAPEGEADPRSLLARERGKAGKKKAKKLKTKMMTKGAEYEASLSAPNKHLDSPNRAKIGKSLRDIDKLLTTQGKGAWPNNSVSLLERAFGEISRSLDRCNTKDQDVFYALGGFDILARIYKMVEEGRGGNTCAIPIKSLVSAGRVLLKATTNSHTNTEFMLLSNRLSQLADILLLQLGRLVPDPATRQDIDHSSQGPDTDPLSLSIMQFMSGIILQMSQAEMAPASLLRLQDLVSYIVCTETVDLLAGYFQLVRDPIDSSPEVAEFLLASLQFLTALTSAVELKGGDKKVEDHSQLLSALQWTELAGTVSMLYGMLLHQGRDTARDAPPPPLPTHTLAVATETFRLLHRLVQQQLTMVQAVLGSEGISLEFRHIASYLLWYCQHHNETHLLNQVIILVGFFTANHVDNQGIVQSGSQPSVLQQLASLPFQYFSQPELKSILFPTLLSACWGNSVNTAILTQEMSWKLIDDFIRSEEGRSSLLVQLVQGEADSATTHPAQH